jgi:phage FluMu gp28-like protein
MATVPLLHWQKRYIEDENRWRFLAASVQVGKSYAASLKHVLKRLKKRGLSILLSASDRQSIELMQKVKSHCSAMQIAVNESSEFFESTSIVQHTADFPNGSRIIALPANPDTARGYSGDVLLDEFAIHRDGRAIWAAMIGRATRGFEVDVLSSFKGTDNKFYEIAKELGLHEGIRPEKQPVRVSNSVWSGHWIDIYMAREEGLKVDIEGIRAALSDEEIFLQEYCCVPMSGAEEFIPLELVLGCESPDASIELMNLPGDEIYAGMDIGRKKDLSCIWILNRGFEDHLMTRGVITLDRMPFHQQLSVASDICAISQRFCVDATGIGAMLAEELQRKFPGVAEAVQFTAATKERMAVETKRRFEERTIMIPESRQIRRAMQSVKRYVGTTGQMRFDAARTDSGHADEFWALALAISAASTKAYIPASEGGMVGRPVMDNLMEVQF